MKIELIKRKPGEAPSVRVDLDDDYHIDVELSFPFGPRDLAAAMGEAAMIIRNRDRGTGRTTRQLIAAPKGSVFVCKSSQFQYVRFLANHLGRGEKMNHDSIETRHARLLQVLRRIIADGDDDEGCESDWFSLICTVKSAMRDDDIASEYFLNPYRDGVDARRLGAAQVHNPYEIGTSEHRSWHAGWRNA